LNNKDLFFYDTRLDRETKAKKLKRWGIILLSFFFHFLVAFLVLYGPLINSENNFPKLRVVDVYLSAMPPVPPASMRGALKKTQKKTKLVKKKIKKKLEINKKSVLIVPVEIPGEIVDEDDDLLVSDVAFGAGGGVEGGIEGGVEGGVIGGSILGETVEEEVEPVRITGKPILLKYVKPIYPPEAIKLRVKGNLVMELVTNKFGKVVKCRVIVGHPLLNQAAIDAVKQWVYKPYLVNGKPTPIIATVLVDFTNANN